MEDKKDDALQHDQHPEENTSSETNEVSSATGGTDQVDPATEEKPAPKEEPIKAESATVPEPETAEDVEEAKSDEPIVDQEDDALQHDQHPEENTSLESNEVSSSPDAPDHVEPATEEKPVPTEEPAVAEAATAPETESEKTEDVKEVKSDEHEEDDEYAEHHREMPDYEHMPVAKLIEAAQKLLENQAVNEIKDEIELIYRSATHQLDDIRHEKLHAFVDGGGNELDFTLDQPQKREIQRLYQEFKAKRHQFYKDLEEQLAVNLDVKKSIIEAIKELPAAEGIVKDKYATFRELQDRWRNTGHVPRAESRELWNNYHFHVDNFYDFLKISDELRELDFKKNLEKKTALCEEAEKIAEEDVSAETFKHLQELHAKWKQIGPVDREHREPMWERFSAATKTIHDKRHEHFRTLKASREELIEKKREILTAFGELKLDDLKTHSAWQSAIKQANKFRDEFRAIGRINLPGNDEVWERYREINQQFNRTKNAFYKTLKKEHHENLKRKRDLLERAKELKDSSDWRNTADKLKRIQADWKKIGYVPKGESDKIWKEFRQTCNHFFNRLTEHNKDLDKAFEANLVKKKELLEKLKVWKSPAGKSAIEELKQHIAAWKEAGRIPRAAREIEAEFNKLLDTHFQQLKLNKKEASMIRFENKMQGLATQQNDRQLDREEDVLRRKIDEAKKELVQLENNIQFFAHVDENNPIVKEANRNIERQKEHIELLKSKIKMLRTIAKEGSKPAHKEATPAVDKAENAENESADSAE